MVIDQRQSLRLIKRLSSQPMTTIIATDQKTTSVTHQKTIIAIKNYHCSKKKKTIIATEQKLSLQLEKKL